MKGDVCRYCGCTDDHACIEDDGTACSWLIMAGNQSVCSKCAKDRQHEKRYI